MYALSGTFTVFPRFESGITRGRYPGRDPIFRNNLRIGIYPISVFYISWTSPITGFKEGWLFMKKVITAVQ